VRRPIDPTYQAIGHRIAQARRTTGYTQQQLADRTGIPRPTIAGIERGYHRVYVDRLRAIAEALDTTAEHLTGEKP
jgi:transcriptional regulator with XRE-family HTH domain